MSAKDIHVAPISRQDADKVVKRVHYSGKVVNNSQLHLGVFLKGRLEGAMQFGPSLDKRKLVGLVRDTQWNGFIELNRMAFGEALPRNSESRALAVAFRLMRKHYPHIEWIVSFADGTQCGDGTIYRASGFVLTGIKKNNQIWVAPEGSTFARMSLTDNRSAGQKETAQKIMRTTATKGSNIICSMSLRSNGSGYAAAAAAAMNNGAASMKAYEAAGFKPLEGFQLRYVYFLNPAARERLTVPVLPFSKIEEMGAAMYRGEKITHHTKAREASDGRGHRHSGGVAPTRALHSEGGEQ